MATIVGVATSDSDFSILVAAIGFIDGEKGTSYGATLDDPAQTLTVFAPTNAAFGQLAVDFGFAGDPDDAGAVTAFLTGLGADTLETVVTYHVLPTAQSAADIASAGSLTTLQGGLIDASELPTLGDLEPDLINPTLIKTNIFADNGIVHVIDRVLLPQDFDGNDAKTITGLVLESGSGFDDNGEDFDLLREAVVAAGLAGTLDDVAADLTVFAPNDAAFIGLAQTLGFDGDDEEGAFGYIVDALTLLNHGDDPIALLTDILTYHVAGQSLQESQIAAAGSVATLQGGTLTLDGLSLVDADPDVPNPTLIATDIQAANGIVHVIDGVLLPVDVLAAEDPEDAAEIDFVIAGDGVDIIATGDGDDLVSTKGGHDFVDAGGDDDLVLAGAGDDVIFGDDGDDKLLGEAGNDVLIGWDDDDTVIGGTGNDLLTGDQGDDSIEGGSGRDDILGGSGDDTVLAGSGDDIALAGSGDDSVDGGAGGDILLGGRGDDTITGGSGDDILLGEQNDDVLIGGAGDDYHIGGSGEDTFVFATGDGTDIIQDFRLGHDTLDVSAFGLAGFEAIEGKITNGFGFAEMRLDAETHVILLGVNGNALDSDDFQF